MKRKKLLFMMAAVFLIVLFPAPVKAAPNISSAYYCVVDRETGQPIWGHNANVRRPMASTTKMMTAILALEYADLDEIAAVSKYADGTPEFTI
ncbi:MAG: hypothetical protein PHF24_10555, partial [Syntrophomonas sp.]|nr:hypothetical protein [Syntrophomonas sp.]